MKVSIATVPNGKYRYGYCLVDLYGRKYYTKFTDYEVNRHLKLRFRRNFPGFRKWVYTPMSKFLDL